MRCARGGAGTPSFADGTSTHFPSSPTVQPWYAHFRQPSATVPADRGASRWGHRSGAATTAPEGVRHNTTRRPSNVIPTGDVATSTDLATACHESATTELEQRMSLTTATLPSPGKRRTRQRASTCG